MQTTRTLSALAAALTLSLTTPALASPARDLVGATAANASPTAHIEPWLGPTQNPAHSAHRAHSYIQLGGPMIRLHDVGASHARPTHCRPSNACSLIRLVQETV
jgi:hypothetical protein